MMPCTVLGYIPLLEGIGWRGSGGRGSNMAAAPSTGPMETGWRGSIGRGSDMAASPYTGPMETGWRRSGERGSLMAAAPYTQPTVHFLAQQCFCMVDHGVFGVH